MQRQQPSDRKKKFHTVEEIENYFNCPKGIELNLQLVSKDNQKYKDEPYMYIMERMTEIQDGKVNAQMESKYFAMLIEVSNHYHAVPYHNITHGFDVMRAVDKYLTQYQMQTIIGLNNQQLIHMLIAAYAHDNGHQGLTNNFYINSEHYLATSYENKSPLENMHSHNLLTAFKKFHIHVQPHIRELMIKLILATDNKHHFQLLNKIQLFNEETIKNLQKALCIDEVQNESKENSQKLSNQNRQTILEMIIHTADLNTCGKTIPQYLKWNQKLYAQFKYEYYQERQLNLKKYTFNFDLSNEKKSFAKENLSFLNKMILPFFKQVAFVMRPFEKQYQNAIEIKDYFQNQVNKLQQPQQQNKATEINNK